MYTIENLKADVATEAQLLRMNATQEELMRINLNKLEPDMYDACIYGMATGNCHSERAAELIEKCCVQYFRNGKITNIMHEGFNGILSRLNGKTVEGFMHSRTAFSNEAKHFSAIEVYILLPEANHANLIAYLRSETETLEL